MTISRDARLQNISDAFNALLDALGERSIAVAYFDPAEAQFSGILPTTWTQLLKCYALRDESTLGGRQYRFTGSGWYRALRDTGRYQDPKFIESLSLIAAAFKDSIKGRDAEAVLYPESVAAQCRLSVHFLYNVIEGEALDSQFNMSGVTWRSRGFSIRVPVDFGLEPL